nr:hypothetical protein [Tanacetum cinerariifolium]
MLVALGVPEEECDLDRSQASTTHFQSEGLNMRQRRWMELFSDYGCKTKMIQAEISEKMLIVLVETSKAENASTEMLHGLDQRMKKIDGGVVRFGKKGELAHRFFARLSEGNWNLLCIMHESEKTAWPIMVRRKSKKMAWPIVVRHAYVKMVWPSVRPERT